MRVQVCVMYRQRLGLLSDTELDHAGPSYPSSQKVFGEARHERLSLQIHENLKDRNDW